MPLYEYVCDECEYIFERIEKEPTTHDCPNCGKKVHINYGALTTHVEYLCDGFHNTDYQRKKK